MCSIPAENSRSYLRQASAAFLSPETRPLTSMARSTTAPQIARDKRGRRGQAQQLRFGVYRRDEDQKSSATARWRRGLPGGPGAKAAIRARLAPTRPQGPVPAGIRTRGVRGMRHKQPISWRRMHRAAHQRRQRCQRALVHRHDRQWQRDSGLYQSNALVGVQCTPGVCPTVCLHRAGRLELRPAVQ